MITLLRNLNKNEVKHSICPKNKWSLFIPSGRSSCIVSTGRSAIAYLIRKLKLKVTDTVLIPAYIAEGVIQPFIEAQIQICFYQLLPDLTPNLKDIQQHITNHSSICLCVVVHPLGFEAPIPEIKNVLESKGISLFEDCAQGIFSHYKMGGSFGTQGDFSLYSLNKFLPVADGALLISNVDEVKVEVDYKVTSIPHERAITEYFQHLYTNNQLLHSNNIVECNRLILDSGVAYEKYYSVISKEISPYRQNEISKKIGNTILYEELIENRKRNTKLLYDNLDRNNIKLVNEEYHEGIIPMAVPIKAPVEKRTAWIEQMKSKGILLSTLIDKWNFIPQHEQQRYKIEMNYIDSHLLIPVSEYISELNMQKIVTELNNLN
jgi:dTDP-4-amino-4,6-dideoxygalactose transaminase